MTHVTPPSSGDTASDVSRRTVVVGAAWTIPIVAAAVGAPLAAASTPCTGATLNNWRPADGTTSLAYPETGATVVGWNTTLAPSGNLYYGNGLIASGVTSASNDHDTFGAPVDFITYMSNGVAYTRQGDGISVNTPNPAAVVPAGSVVVGWTTYLSPNGDLYYGNSVIANGVTSASADHDAASGTNRDFISYVSNGAAYNNVGDGFVVFGATPAPAVPAGSTVAGWNTFIAPNGDLYYGNTVLATDVTSAVTEHTNITSSDYMSYVSNGVAYTWSTNSGITAVAGVPAGSTAVGWNTFIAPNRALYFGATLVASGVLSAIGQHQEEAGPQDFLTYITAC